MHSAACQFADAYTRVSRAPITILLLVPVGAAVLIAGWLLDAFTPTMIAVTLVLSFDASLMSRCVALEQGKQTGDVDLES